MKGPMTGVDPDQVENETGIFWRTLYKLEKGFQENPNPLKMAKKACISLELHSYMYLLYQLVFCCSWSVLLNTHASLFVVDRLKIMWTHSKSIYL